MKSDTIVWLGVIGAGVYLVSKSKILDGVSEASSGIGSGISQVAGATGSTAQELAQFLGTGFNLGSQIGQSATNTVREVFYQTEQITRDGGQVVSNLIKESGADTVKTVDYLGDIPRETSGLISDWFKFGRETWSPFSPTSIFQVTGNALKNFMSSQASPDENKAQVQQSANPQNNITAVITASATPKTNLTPKQLFNVSSSGGGSKVSSVIKTSSATPTPIKATPTTVLSIGATQSINKVKQVVGNVGRSVSSIASKIGSVFRR